MTNLRLIALHEFLKNVRRRSFLFAVFGTPLITIGAMVLIIFATAAVEEGGSITGERVGYVDEAGVLVGDVPVPENFIAYETADAASAALDAGDIDTYAVIPPTYIQRGQVALYSYGVVPEDLQDTIEAFIGDHLVAQLQTSSDLPPDRLADPLDLQVFLESSQRQLAGPESVIALLIIPAALAFVFVFALQMSSGFLMQGIVEEKSTRMVEVMMTTVTPMQLLAGKMIGLGVLGLLPVLAWILIGVVGFLLFGDAPALQSVVIPLDLVLAALLYFILTYFMIASVLSALGTIVGGEQESRQYAGIVSLIVIVPFFAFFQFFTDPNGTVPVVMSLIPGVSSTAMIMRMGFTVVPTWQILASLGILLVTTLVLIWGSARVFRWGLLLYGKKVGPRMIWRVLTRRVESGTLVTAKEG